MANFITEDMIEQAILSKLKEAPFEYDIITCDADPNKRDDLNDGTGRSSKRECVLPYILEESLKKINPDILVEQAAGITNGQQVYDFIMAGSEAAGAASGIMNAKDPIAMIDEMIAATRRAADDLKKK